MGSYPTACCGWVFDLTYDDQINYNKWLANEAHQRNLSIALKNDLEPVKELVNNYDFAINEECYYYAKNFTGVKPHPLG
ncbi:hypothetical protein COV12_03660 [Candidatus Woesearchaeota archaeon CG10_big_fil_rev_8_21_14_0_10_32_24]|nr:MAG: hypothetical protein COV12_03660 [Candidatus Woesearchaeota archaeon CG10_big_fil_rev_8_21_14_0_10_32_24]